MYYTPSGATVSGDGSVDASANIVLGNGVVTITLTDLLQNPTCSGQTLSGIVFDVSGASGTPTLATASGYTSTITTSKTPSDNGTYTAGTLTDLMSTSTTGHWSVDNSKSSSTINLSIFSGAKPNELIIGPDSMGGFAGGSGRYSNANGGFDQFNPYVLGSATFTVDISGVTSNSTLSNVVFDFGTGAATVNGVPESYSPVPEVSTLYGSAPIALALLPFSAALLAGLRNRRVFKTVENP
jgi:hypothetical protein